MNNVLLPCSIYSNELPDNYKALPVDGADSGIIIVSSATVGVTVDSASVVGVGSVVCAKVIVAAAIADTAKTPDKITAFFNIVQSPPFIIPLRNQVVVCICRKMSGELILAPP